MRKSRSAISHSLPVFPSQIQKKNKRHIHKKRFIFIYRDRVGLVFQITSSFFVLVLVLLPFFFFTFFTLLYFSCFLEVLLLAARNDDVVDLQHHAAELGSEQELLALGDEGIDDEVVLHVCGGE